MTIQEVHQAREQAQRDITRADAVAREVAYLCVGRLRLAKVSSWTLKQLKRELQDFNSTTGKWKDSK